MEAALEIKDWQGRVYVIPRTSLSYGTTMPGSMDEVETVVVLVDGTYISVSSHESQEEALASLRELFRQAAQ